MKTIPVSALLCAALCSPVMAVTVITVDPASFTGTEIVDFEDLGLGPFDIVNFDSEFESGTVQFSAGFVGQTIDNSGIFDTVSGLPTGPLTLFDDVPGQNIVAADGADFNIGNTSIIGVGSLGFPDADAIGEGVISVLFDFDQSEFGFDLIGGDGGTATLSFFGRDGSLLSEITTDPLFGSLSLGFATDDGSTSIAGVSITNIDIAGIGVDNVVFDVAGVVGPPPVTPGTPGTPPTAVVPLPAGGLLLGTALLGLGLTRRKSTKLS